MGLSIDDFGTGYSSLSHLARMPVDEVKIDRSFVQGLESDPEFAPVVRSAIDMGHGLGLKVVAEGIETEAAADRACASSAATSARDICMPNPCPWTAFEAWLAGQGASAGGRRPGRFSGTEDLSDTVTLAVY